MIEIISKFLTLFKKCNIESSFSDILLVTIGIVVFYFVCFIISLFFEAKTNDKDI